MSSKRDCPEGESDKAPLKRCKAGNEPTATGEAPAATEESENGMGMAMEEEHPDGDISRHVATGGVPVSDDDEESVSEDEGDTMHNNNKVKKMKNK